MKTVILALTLAFLAACVAAPRLVMTDRCHTVTLVRFVVHPQADTERLVTFGEKTYMLKPGSITEFTYGGELTYAINGHVLPLPFRAPRDEFGAIEIQVP